jgi:ABC-type multidrug transport system ATPase subunit
VTTTNDDFAFVDVRELSRHYGRRRALAKVSFRCEAGTITGLLGPNGAGKSTLLSVLATTTAPSTGEVKFGSLDAAEHGAAIRARLGVLGHDLYLYPELTARENLQFFSGLTACRHRVDYWPRRGAAARTAATRVGVLRACGSGCPRARCWPRRGCCCSTNRSRSTTSTHLLVARIRSLRDAGRSCRSRRDLDVIEGLLDQVIFLRDGRLRVCEPAGPGIRRRYRDLMATA